MKRLLFVCLTIMIILNSCYKNEDKSNLPDGLFIERSPVQDRTQLEFINGNLMIQSAVGSAYKDTFNFKILDGKIRLRNIGSSEYYSDFHFEMINKSEIKIGNLYPSIPEAPDTYMTFGK
jgi:hypothetical protein